jgi:RNase P subunit RPR2
MGKKIIKNFINNYDFKDGEIFNRMNYLFKISDKIYNKNKNLSKLYISIMKDISKRNAIRIEKKIKRLICFKCNNLLYKDFDTETKFINISGKYSIQYICSKCFNISKIIIF